MCRLVTRWGGTWWDWNWSLSLGLLLPSVHRHCLLGHLTRKNSSPIWPIMCLVGCQTLLNQSIVCCGMQRMAYSVRIALPCIVNGDDSAGFSFFCHRWPWVLTLTFKLWRDLCTMHLTAKFYHPTFNHLEVIMWTNKTQTDAAENIHLSSLPLCYAGG